MGGMPDLQIRPATHADLEALDLLYYAFHQHHALAVPHRLIDLGDLADQDWTEFHRLIDQILADPEAVILLACLENQAVGLVEVYLRQRTARLVVPGRYGLVQSLFVTPACRGRGVGRELMAAAAAWAGERGATEMRLEVWEFSRDAMRLYESLGYASDLRSMSLPLARPAP